MTATRTPASAWPRRALASAALLAGAVGAACSSDGGTSPLSDADYRASMTEVCAETNDRLAELPEPPGQISAENWALEVARAFRAEGTAATNLVVDESVRDLHRTFTTTTQDLADRYDDLSSTLVTDPDAIGEVNTDITELSLGRDDLAAELGLTECVRR